MTGTGVGDVGTVGQLEGAAGIEVVEQEKFVPPPPGSPATTAAYAEQALLMSVVTTLFSSTVNCSCTGDPW